jgi:type IV secretion system protein VirB3
MASVGKVKTDPLFAGLTRPPMLFGVSYMMAAFNGFVSMLYMINFSNLVVFLVMASSLHAIGYIICFYEPLYIHLWATRVGKCSRCRNRVYHGWVNSYEVY